MVKSKVQGCLLREVSSGDDDVAQLYRLLELRRFGLSHHAMPEFEKHRAFVEHHPYRNWYFVDCEHECVGSVYLTKTNNIGINMLDGYSHHIAEALQELMKRHKPLPAIASVRSSCFVVNVSPQDKDLIEALEQVHGTLLQHTYLLPASPG